MADSVKERLIKFLEHERVSKAEFGRKIGVSSAYVTSIRKSIDKDKMKSIALNYPNLNLNWLLYGEGEMLKTNQTAVKDYSATRKLIPLYADVTSIGGNNGPSADVVTPYGNVLEWIDAGDWFPGATSAIHHYGDSMVEYPSGCILALRRVEDTRLIINGKAYVIETDEFRITKQLQYDGGDYLMAYSSNNAKYDDGRLIHAPIRIPIDAVRHIDLVIGYVVKEFSNGAIRIINTSR